MPNLLRSIPIRHAIFAASLGLSMTTQVHAAPSPALAYPESRKDDVAEVQFGEKIADPYRWLENDVRSDRDVADWVKRQSAFTESYLASLPSRICRQSEEVCCYPEHRLPSRLGHHHRDRLCL